MFTALDTGAPNELPPLRGFSHPSETERTRSNESDFDPGASSCGADNGDSDDDHLLCGAALGEGGSSECRTARIGSGDPVIW